MSNTDFEKKAQLLLTKIIPSIADYLRNEVAPYIKLTSDITIKPFDLARINKIIGESIMQSGFPVLSFKLINEPINPFAKALSLNTITTTTST